jgi:hypothetical protein
MGVRWLKRVLCTSIIFIYCLLFDVSTKFSSRCALYTLVHETISFGLVFFQLSTTKMPDYGTKIFKLAVTILFAVVFGALDSGRQQKLLIALLRPLNNLQTSKSFPSLYPKPQKPPSPSPSPSPSFLPFLISSLAPLGSYPVPASGCLRL